MSPYVPRYARVPAPIYYDQKKRPSAHVGNQLGSTMNASMVIFDTRDDRSIWYWQM
jgi:hypothetical protein